MNGADFAPRFFMPAGHTIAKFDAHRIPFSGTSCRQTGRYQRGVIGGARRGSDESRSSKRSGGDPPAMMPRH